MGWKRELPFIEMKEQYLLTNFLFVTSVFICMIFDLRSHQVPMLLDIVILTGASIYALFTYFWAPVLLVILFILLSDIRKRVLRVVLALLLSILSAFFQPASFLICLVMLLLWLLWEFGFLGGADVKLMIAGLFVFGNPVFLIPVSFFGGLQGLVASFRKKNEIPFVVSIFCGTLFTVIYPLFST